MANASCSMEARRTRTRLSRLDRFAWSSTGQLHRSHDERPTETRRSVDSQNLRGRFPNNYFKTFPPLAKRGALRLNAPALLPRRLCEQTATVRAYGRCRAGAVTGEGGMGRMVRPP